MKVRVQAMVSQVVHDELSKEADKKQISISAVVRQKLLKQIEDEKRNLSK